MRIFCGTGNRLRREFKITHEVGITPIGVVFIPGEKKVEFVNILLMACRIGFC